MKQVWKKVWPIGRKVHAIDMFDFHRYVCGRERRCDRPEYAPGTDDKKCDKCVVKVITNRLVGKW